MTVIQASKVLGLKVRTIREWISTGRLPASKIGNKLIIPDDVIFSKEVQDRANKGREHSRRIKECAELGVLARRSKNTEESV